ncbi:hypothetical protein CAPTEDRAFT_189474 [Capitella teleta]|uniref:Major facilitator superfamily (MFS) profile domain-containing protein n=1 Tax=Capitella teleta TaxID=283909 RepID=R7V7H8_CAPTE|nr:hypothetical protein CAPTEDRAFT_189474 [Capitella teleta]|eukprot:ELU12331.1 hypothetical protein CAPTEDRAFT_189474 [Capitella teleta]
MLHSQLGGPRVNKFENHWFNRSNMLQYSQLEAGWLSTAFEIGGMLGTVAASSILIPFFKERTLSILCALIGFSVFTFLIFASSSHFSSLGLIFILALCGALNCAPDALLAGSVPTEIGESFGRESGAGVTGFVNGFGSLGAVLEGPLIAYIFSNYGWNSLSYAMSILSLVAFVLVCRVRSVLSQDL